MTEINQVYKCEVCGNIVEIISKVAGVLTCCGKDMVLQTENTKEASVEKHIPVFKTDDEVITVSVGDVAHPMDDKHYIEWIEIITKNKVYRKNLNHVDNAKAEFTVPIVERIVKIRAYCNIHGLWSTTKHLSEK